MIYECLAAPLPDVPALCFPQELEAFHPEAVPRRGSVQKRQVRGKGNQALWKWQRAPGHCSDVSAAFIELHLLFTSCRFH